MITIYDVLNKIEEQKRDEISPLEYVVLDCAK